MSAAAGDSTIPQIDAGLKPGSKKWRKAQADRFVLIVRRNKEQMLV